MIDSSRAPDIFQRPAFARVRRRCLAMPEAAEGVAWGHPVFRVGKKTFCTFEIVQGRPSIAFRLAPADVARVEKGTHGFATPYGRGLWASVWVDAAVDGKLMATLVDRSYRVVASKQLVALLDAGAGVAPSRPAGRRAT